MLSHEENQLLTETDRGAPMGELFRRFWLPALLSEEIPAEDCDPVRVRIMGEDLIAFRDSEGRPGVVSAYCAHRGAPMFFARNEECGLRCVYHGWKYDVTGQCVDIPSIPNGDAVAKRMRITAYPAHEAANLIWIYMGPPELEPPFPEFPACELSNDKIYVTKIELACNWLQAQEGDFDPVHGQFLHSTINGTDLRKNLTGDRDSKARAFREQLGSGAIFTETVASANTTSGVLFATASPIAEDEVRIDGVHFILPCFSSSGVSGSKRRDVQSMNIRVPIDDTHMMNFRMRWSPSGFTTKELWEYTHGGYVFAHRIPGTYRSVQNKDNGYLVDPVLRRQFNYTGATSFPVQDQIVVEDQWGPIQDRTKEHLVASDVRIIFIRHRLLEMARGVANGIEPEEPRSLQDFCQKSSATEPMVIAPTKRLSPELVKQLAVDFHATLRESPATHELPTS